MYTPSLGKGIMMHENVYSFGQRGLRVTSAGSGAHESPAPLSCSLCTFVETLWVCLTRQRNGTCVSIGLRQTCAGSTLTHISICLALVALIEHQLSFLVACSVEATVCVRTSCICVVPRPQLDWGRSIRDLRMWAELDWGQCLVFGGGCQ